MVSRIPILQTCQCCCSTEAETGFVPTSAQFFAVGTFLILMSPSWTRSCIQKVPRVNVLRSLSCSQSIRQRIRRRTVTLYFNLHWNSQILVHRSQGYSNLTFFNHSVRTPPFQRSRLSSSEAWIQISQCGYQSEPPVPSCSSSRLGRQSLSTKTVFLSTCFCLRNLSVALGFPTRYLAARLNGSKSNSRGSLILWAKCFAVSARSNLSWAKYESHIQADLYLVASSPFKIGLNLPSNTSLSCSFSRGVLTLLVFVLHPDSLMMSGACLKSGPMSKYCPV